MITENKTRITQNNREASRRGTWLRNWDTTSAYDFLMRAATATTYAFLVGVQGRTLFAVADAPRTDGRDVLFATDIAAKVSVILLLALFIVMVVIRMRPIAKAGGIEPRLSALIGSFLTMGLLFCPGIPLPAGANIASVVLILSGETLAIYVLFRLGRSFSLMAEARRLITDGPYARIRHPLYLAEEIAVLGVYMQHIAPAATVLLIVHFAFQLRRMMNEERVLLSAFPEYAAYAAQTPRLIPGIF